MKILIAGATGAVGQPLLDLLAPLGHEVYGISRSEEKAQSIIEKGAKAIVLDVLNHDAVFSTMEEIKPDIIVDMLTSLPRHYSPASMQKAAEMNTKIRMEGGQNLLSAAEKYGTKRYISQSSAFLYSSGIGLATERDLLAFNAPPGISAGTRLYDEIEKRTLNAKNIKGVALRFGFFYGPGTWFHPGEDVADQIQQEQFPVIGSGKGIWSFIHVEDAAKGIIAAFESEPGIYNIVNDNPTEMRVWLPAFAEFIGAKVPPTITEAEGDAVAGPDFVYYAMQLRGASNEKAKQMLQLKPRHLEWLRL